MCGIFGVAFPKRDVRDEMRAMLEPLRHRGPDGEALEELECGTLGHLRLSILDLSAAGAQPMWDAERKVCITYNGEIYNFRSLREECLDNGLTFRSTSDTEVILNQYLLHGEAAFERLNGMFVFCLFDARHQRFYLARDRMGIKPLYYCDTLSGFFFASELGALIHSGVAPVEIDSTALAAFLQFDFVPSPLTILRGVRKLPGGSMLTVTRDGIVSTSFAPRRGSAYESGTIEEDLQELDRRLSDAVARQMIADVPVGVFLSGGLDSSLVARAASAVTPGRISTFSVGFEEASFDESKYFNEVARRIGSDHHSEVLRPQQMLDILPRVASITSEPIADGSIFPTILLSSFTRQHVKVALSGDGADELFAGYPTYPAAYAGEVLSRLPSSVRRSLLRLSHATLAVRHENMSLGFRATKFLEGLHPDPLLRNQRWLGSFHSGELASVMNSQDASSQSAIENLLARTAEPGVRHSLLERLLRADQRFYLQDGVLVKVDRASMASSLEVRVPFLDDVMVSFAQGLPRNRKLRGVKGKEILRRYAMGEAGGKAGTNALPPLPPSVVGRRKKGFGAPLGAWFRGPLKPLLFDVLSERRIKAMGVLNPAAIFRLLSEHGSGARDHRKKLFNVLTLVLWWEFAQNASRGGRR